MNLRKKIIKKVLLYDYLSTQDGGEGSGNFGHKGRPGEVGGSGKGGLSKVSGGGVQAKGYSLTSSKVGRSKGADRVFVSKGKPTSNLPKGSGSTVLHESDLKSGVHSCVKYLDENGNLAPEREQLHANAINKLFEGKKPVPEGETKQFFLLGGGPASGKSSLTAEDSHKRFGVPSKKEQVTIDPDEMKKELKPEYGIKNRDAAANFVHEESSAIAKRAMQAAFENGYNVTLDGTGNGSISSLRKKIENARNAGYRVEGAYVTCPIEESIAREKWRHDHPKPGEESRVVPLPKLKKTHAAVSKIFPQIASEFDHVTLYDTRGPKGTPPTLIAECFRGEPIRVVNEKLYREFLEKGNL